MIFDAPDRDFERRIRASFVRQGLNETIGATLASIEAGYVEIGVPFTAGVSQQHGFFHGSVMGAIGDSACGYAAMTLTPPGAEVLTVEYKINFLAPGRGERLIARARVTRAGRTVTVCAGDVFAVMGNEEKLVATMLATIMTVGLPRGNVSESSPASAQAVVKDARPSSLPWCPCRRLRSVGRRLCDLAGSHRSAVC